MPNAFSEVTELVQKGDFIQIEVSTGKTYFGKVVRKGFSWMTIRDMDSKEWNIRLDSVVAFNLSEAKK